jgi:phospholipid/cholesterol/gamma-HCH transport system ATP-binding protein
MIKIKNIYKQFSLKHVLCKINFEVYNSEILVIIGPSGAGKSILLKAMVGLVKPDNGSIEIENINIVTCSYLNLYKIQKKMGYVFQENALFDSLNIFDNVAFGLKNLTSLNKNEIKQRVKYCLSMVNLANIENLRPNELSGGMKKRVAIARAMAYQPHYILYDEPTAGLDPIMTNVINNLILNLKKHLHVSSVVVTHDIKSAHKIADRIIMLHKGRIIFNGKPESIKYTKNKYIHQFMENSNYSPLKYLK